MILCRLFALKPLTLGDLLQKDQVQKTSQSAKERSEQQQQQNGNYWSTNTEDLSLDYGPAFRPVYIVQPNSNIGGAASGLPANRNTRGRSFSPPKYSRSHGEKENYDGKSGGGGKESGNKESADYKTKRKRSIFASDDKLLRKSFSTEQLPDLNANRYTYGGIKGFQTQSLSSGSSSNSGA